MFEAKFLSVFQMLCGKCYDLHYIIGLHLRLMCCLVALDLTALGAFVNDDITLLRIGDTADRLHLSPAFVGTVTGVLVNMERPEADGTVIA